MKKKVLSMEEKVAAYFAAASTVQYAEKSTIPPPPRKRLSYVAKHVKKDKLFYFMVRVRACVRNGFNRGGTVKSNTTANILCISFKEFNSYLLKKAGVSSIDGYTLDHILPMALAYDEESVILLNHYKNFQLLTLADNVAKGDILPDGRNARSLSIDERKGILQDYKKNVLKASAL